MNELVTDGFAHDFAFEVIDEVSTPDAVWYFPGNTTRGGKDGLMVKVDALSRWIGVFAFGRSSPSGLSAVCSCPHRGRLLVVSRGQGTYVDVNSPSESQQVPLDPVMQVCPVPDPGLLVLADFTNLAAYGSNGLAWRTTRVSWDGIEAVRLNEKEQLVGQAWDAPSGKFVEFEVELSTGHCRGAPYPIEKPSRWSRRSARRFPV